MFHPENKTLELSKLLARETSGSVLLTESKKRDLRFSRFALQWSVGAAVTTLLAWKLLPVRTDMPEQLRTAGFYLLTGLWLLSSLLMGHQFFGFAFPETGANETSRRSIVRTRQLALLPLAVIGLISFSTIHFDDLTFQIYRDSHAFNGGCGMVIFVAGSIQAAFLYSWMKKGATTRQAEAGMWAALSTGAFTSFLISFACQNEHPLHILIWHFLPLGGLALLSGLVARKFLRW
ncbi:MAG: DUF1109 family protein [Cryobacterium sp.]|nr:DUF1109 family protein [Oligoflexia bacterium]